ncbi:hypothetical protein FB451DRAFT_311995 [Mycena latifolia]|nr:hypothetical protein FB451DRAFT_311995 [Mycena latifolia]
MRTTSLSLLLTASFSSALVNITVDDTDASSSIYFTSPTCVALEPDGASASWEVSPGRFVHSCHNKTLRRCTEAGATISFKFTGVAVYLVYPPWPHEMTITAALDSNLPITLTIPARSEGDTDDLDVGASSAPVWGVSGLQNTEHTLTIGREEPGGVYVDAFMYTALCDTQPCDRRRRKGVGEPDSSAEDDSGTTPAPSSSSAHPSSSAPPSSSVPPASSVSPSSSVPPSSSVSPSSASTSSLPPTTVISQAALPHKDTVGIALGTILGVLVVAIVLFFAWRRYRRRKPTPDALEEKQPSPPYSASYVSSATSAEIMRPPSMRERADRFSYAHTPAGTPLTGTPASCLTSLSSNSMRLAHLSALPGASEKSTSAHSPSSVNGTSIEDGESEARFEAPPPEYETSQ